MDSKQQMLDVKVMLTQVAIRATCLLRANTLLIIKAIMLTSKST